MLALAALLPARAQLVGSFTFTTTGLGSSDIVDPGCVTVDLPSLTGNLELYLTAKGVRARTGTVTFYLITSPDNTIWTQTNSTKHTYTLPLSNTAAVVVWTNIDVTPFRYVKVGAVSHDDTENAVTNLAGTYYRKKP